MMCYNSAICILQYVYIIYNIYIYTYTTRELVRMMVIGLDILHRNTMNVIIIVYFSTGTWPVFFCGYPPAIHHGWKIMIFPAINHLEPSKKRLSINFWVPLVILQFKGWPREFPTTAPKAQREGATSWSLTSHGKLSIKQPFFQ